MPHFAWHLCWRRVQFYCPSCTYPAITYCTIFHILNPLWCWQYDEIDSFLVMSSHGSNNYDGGGFNEYCSKTFYVRVTKSSFSAHHKIKWGNFFFQDEIISRQLYYNAVVWSRPNKCFNKVEKESSWRSLINVKWGWKWRKI